MDGKIFEKLIEVSECAFFISKPGGEMEITYASKKFYSILQYTKEEFQEKFKNSLMAVILPEEKQKVKNLIARQFAAGGAVNIECRVKRKDGTTAWLSISAKTLLHMSENRFFCSCLDITKSRNNVENMFKAKHEIDVIANSIPGGVLKIRMKDMKILYANDGYYMLSGYSRAEFHINFGDYCDKIIYPADMKMVKSVFGTTVENNGLLGFEHRIVGKTGHTKWLYVNGRKIDDESGEDVYLCVLMDVTSRKSMEAEFEENIRRFKYVSEYLKETMWTYDINNKTFTRSGSLGESFSKENFLRTWDDMPEMLELFHPDDAKIFEKNVKNRIENIGSSRYIYRIRDNSSMFRNVEICAVSVSDNGNDKPDKIYTVTRLVDNAEEISSRLDHEREEISERNKLVNMAKSAQAQAEDNITSLMPYASFMNKAEKILSKRKEKEHYALVCADINEFRKFSHHYGFSISNRILEEFSKTLLNNLAKEGVCSRVDGDYFVLLTKYESHKELLRMMSEMVRARNVAEEEEKDVNIEFGTTTGIYLVQESDCELLEMLEKADMARRSIKGLRGNHYAIYTDDLKSEQFKEEETISEVYDAVRNNDIEICYMPRIKGDREKIVGCKAVPRVQLKDGHVLESDELTRLIERGGKMSSFALATLSTVCCSVGAWKKLGNKIVPFSIEMTASELSIHNVVKKIDDIVVEKNGLEPKDVIIEIQERYLADMTTVLEMAIEKLCGMGYNVVISRFGTDHTAIHSIRKLNVTGIKFHGEYFNEYMTSEKECIILSKTVEMAKSLGLTVTCGGIHTPMHEEFAKKIGCEMFEGDMYYGAVRANVFEKCFLSNL